MHAQVQGDRPCQRHRVALHFNAVVPVDGRPGIEREHGSGRRRERIVAESGDWRSSDFTNVTLTTSGDDIGAAFTSPGSTEVEIPLGIFSFDIGVVPVGGVIGIEYQLGIRSEGLSVEGIFWQFSDPLSVGGTGAFPTVSFQPVTTVIPEPSSLTLLGIGGIDLAGYGWRRKRKSAA